MGLFNLIQTLSPVVKYHMVHSIVPSSQFVVSKIIFSFVQNHIWFSGTFIVVFAIVTYALFKWQFRKDRIKGWILNALLLAGICLYLSISMGLNISIETILNTIWPTQMSVLYVEDSKAQNNPEDLSFRFPILKTLALRIWNDLPMSINNRPYLRLHYFIKTEFNYGKNRTIDHYKKIICILKNLGNKPIVIKEIKNVTIKRNGHDITDYESKDGVKVYLKNELNSALNNEVVVLYPAKELILFESMRSSTNESLAMDLEIEYSELPNENEIYTYYQKDGVSFDNVYRRLLPVSRVIAAKTIFSGSLKDSYIKSRQASIDNYCFSPYMIILIVALVLIIAALVVVIVLKEKILNILTITLGVLALVPFVVSCILYFSSSPLISYEISNKKCFQEGNEYIYDVNLGIKCEKGRALLGDLFFPVETDKTILLQPGCDGNLNFAGVYEETGFTVQAKTDFPEKPFYRGGASHVYFLRFKTAEEKTALSVIFRVDAMVDPAKLGFFSIFQPDYKYRYIANIPIDFKNTDRQKGYCRKAY